MAKKSHEDFVKEVYEAVGDEYTVLSKYNGARNKVKMRHNICGNVWDITPDNFLNGGRRCPVENGNHKYTNEEFVAKLKEINPDIEPLDKYVSFDTNIRFRCLIDEHVFYARPQDIILKKSGCPVCAGKIIVKGINDLWTTNPEIAELLKSPSDGYSYSIGTHTLLEFICPDCGNPKKSRPINLIKHNNLHFSCPKCGDGISFPEKFMYSVLSQLNIDFTYQLTSTTFKWCDKYKYDFYIKDKNCIIETHGAQHYESTGVFSKNITLEEIQLYDKNKKSLAKENNIEKYIVIDCRYSEMEYIKTSILNSELSKMFDLSNIDWLECLKHATKSIIKSICDDWNAHKDIDQLLNKYKIAECTIRKYLKKGSVLNLCNYTEDAKIIKLEKISQKRSKPVYCFATNEVFPSGEYIKEIYGIHIHLACLGRTKTAYGSKWTYVEDLPEDFIFEESTITLEEYLKEYKKCKAKE